MSIPPQPLKLYHAHTSPTHPTMIFLSMLVLDMMLPILPLPLREGMYMQLMVPMITMVLLNPTGTVLSRHGYTLWGFLPGPPSQIWQTTTYTLIWASEGSPQKVNPSAPKKPFEKYDSPVYVPAEVYKLLSPEAVATLKKYSTEAINKFAKIRGIHVTDTADHESSPSDDTILEEQPDPWLFENAPENEIDPILDYINSQQSPGRRYEQCIATIQYYGISNPS